MPIFRSPDGNSPVRRRAGLRILPIILFAIFAFVYYTSNQQVVPLTGRTQLVDMSREQEAQLGLSSYSMILNQSEVIKSGPELAQVRDVGERIAAVVEKELGISFEWEFNLLQSAQINAFCLPGGKVAVFAGILPVAENIDGLATVMGHEIAHAVARHGAERMAQERLAQIGQLAVGVAVSDMDNDKRRAVMGAFGLGTQFGVLLPFSRKHELEADQIGLILMARACFDPREASRFWQRMSQAQRTSGAPPEFLSTHPADERRIAELEAMLPAALAERQKYCPPG